ncbi:MAG TPA: hypothetical protein VGI70_21560, partial [Polyangiales bacterium]
MLCRKHIALGGVLLCRDFFELLLGVAQVRGERVLRRANAFRLELELRHFRVERTQFALHHQRASLIGAAAGDHAALEAGAVRRHERILRIVARQFFRGNRPVGQISCFEPRQKLLRRRSEWVAKFHQLVESRHNAVFSSEIHDRLVFIKAQVQAAQRIDEERRAPADLFAQQRNSRARVIVRLHDDILELIAKILLDRCFVLLFDFGVVRKHTHRVEIVAAAALVRRKQFLHRVRRVRAIVQNLRQRRMLCARPRKGIAQHIGLLRRRIALFTQSRDPRVQRRHLLQQCRQLCIRGFPVKRRLGRVVAHLQRRLQQRSLRRFQFLHRRRLMYE